MSQEKNIIMVGDINICYLSDMYGSNNYISVLYSYGLYNTIQKPTREETYGNTVVSSCLDHVNVKLDPNNSYISFLIESKIADHYWTGIKLLETCTDGTHQTMENEYKSVILTGRVNELIQTENWWPILDLREPSDIYNDIVMRFENIYAKSVIKVKQKTKQLHNSWFNDRIKLMIERKNYLWQMVKRDKHNVDLRNQFRNIRNKLTDMIRNEKRKYYYRAFNDNSNNTKKIWEITNHFINKKNRPSLKESIKLNFNINEDHQIMNLTEKFKNSFKEKIEEITTEMNGQHFDIIPHLKEGNYTIGDRMSMNLKKMKEHQLYSIINKLNNRSSAGPDKIRPKDIINNIFYLKLILMHLINRIIETGKIPQRLKITHLRPIFKNGTKKNVGSYRPIGSISVIMKILEHFICMQLNQYLINQNIIMMLNMGLFQKNQQ
ncbi:uncharacterized protein LOC120354539 [Nilaparvata lugens]|uniref:uncharacterized protein LOC120354539 n=1 Tax=Nilaparvata lugens TaxID=108931 RepID=UPI00193E3F90|nr:uncharacterized protein LOC120354539 [Nilaparvata lugens]